MIIMEDINNSYSGASLSKHLMRCIHQHSGGKREKCRYFKLANAQKRWCVGYWIGHGTQAGPVRQQTPNDHQCNILKIIMKNNTNTTFCANTP